MKGISPLIASVLLIAFTITIAILIVSWGSSFMTTTTSGISNKSTELTECTGASITIDSVYVTTNTLTMVVKNTGVKTISVTSSSVSNTTGAVWINSANLTSVTAMTKGAIGTIVVPTVSLGTPVCSAFSKATISTACPGVIAEWTNAPTTCS